MPSSLSFQEVRLSARTIRSPGAGVESTVELPDSGALPHRLGAIRAAIACYNQVLEYEKIRKQFNDKLITFHEDVWESDHHCRYRHSVFCRCN